MPTAVDCLLELITRAAKGRAQVVLCSHIPLRAAVGCLYAPHGHKEDPADGGVNATNYLRPRRYPSAGRW